MLPKQILEKVSIYDLSALERQFEEEGEFFLHQSTFSSGNDGGRVRHEHRTFVGPRMSGGGRGGMRGGMRGARGAAGGIVTLPELSR